MIGIHNCEEIVSLLSEERNWIGASEHTQVVKTERGQLWWKWVMSMLIEQSNKQPGYISGNYYDVLKLLAC